MSIESNLSACVVKAVMNSEACANVDGSTSYDRFSFEDAIIDAIDSQRQEPTAPVPDATNVRATYTVAELSRMTGMSQHRVKQALKRNGVNLVADGGSQSPTVPLSEFKRALPEVWESVLLARGFKALAKTA